MEQLETPSLLLSYICVYPRLSAARKAGCGLSIHDSPFTIHGSSGTLTIHHLRSSLRQWNP
jgi:hypothetical protein